MRRITGTDEQERKERSPDDVDLKEAILGLDAYDKRDLDSFHKGLMHLKLNSGSCIKDEALKKRLAAFLLYLAEETLPVFERIRMTSYIISGFNEYEFGDSLDKATDIAKNLEESWGSIEGNIPSQWERLKDILLDYG
jgi:hypothetical protein